MKTVVLRHVAFEDLGAFAPALAERGHDFLYVEAGEGLERAEEADLLIVLGGPLGVRDESDYPYLRDEIDLLRTRLHQDLPTLGICLGAQLMAAALGASVYAGEKKELGWGRVSLQGAEADHPLAALRDAPVLHWHGDTFDLPEGATLLASSAVTPHQAFAVGRSLALQFHVEAGGHGFERWLIGHTGELRAEGVDVRALRSDGARHAIAAARAGRTVLHGFLDRA